MINKFLVCINNISWINNFYKTKRAGLHFLRCISGLIALVAIFIALLMITYLIGEIHLSHTIWKVNWWIHSFLILAFLFLIPRSKHLHLVLGPFNIFFKSFDIPEHSPVKIDMDATEEELDNMLTDLNKMTKVVFTILFIKPASYYYINNQNKLNELTGFWGYVVLLWYGRDPRIS